MGPSEAILFILPTILAANWFPHDEWSTAFSIQVLAMQVGAVVASIKFPLLLNSDKSFFNRAYNTTTLSVVQTDKIFIASFGSFTFLMLLTCISTLIYCKDHPPTPPSAAQENSREMMYKSGVSETWREIKKLLLIPQFLLIIIASCFKGTFTFVSILMPSFFLLTFPDLDSRTPGIILVVSMFLGSLVSPVTGRVLDKFKAFKSFTIISEFFII